MKYRRGDKVCALLVANRWGVEFTCFCGRLVNIEERGTVLAAKIMVSVYYDLFVKKTHPPSEFSLDIRLFKLMPWNNETKSHIRAVRQASRTLHELTIRSKKQIV